MNETEMQAYTLNAEVTGQEYFWTFFAPAGIPAQVIAAARQGYQKWLTDGWSTATGESDSERRAKVDGRQARIVEGTYSVSTGGGGRKSTLTTEEKALDYTLERLKIKGKVADFHERLRSYARIQVLSFLAKTDPTKQQELVKPESSDELNLLVDKNLDKVVELLKATETFKKRLAELQNPKPSKVPTSAIALNGLEF